MGAALLAGLVLAPAPALRAQSPAAPAEALAEGSAALEKGDPVTAELGQIAWRQNQPAEAALQAEEQARYRQKLQSSGPRP